jgi:hypothetical protein
MMIPSAFHFPVKDIISVFLMAEKYSIVYMYHMSLPSKHGCYPNTSWKAGALWLLPLQPVDSNCLYQVGLSAGACPCWGLWFQPVDGMSTVDGVPYTSLPDILLSHPSWKVKSNLLRNSLCTIQGTRNV